MSTRPIAVALVVAMVGIPAVAVAQQSPEERAAQLNEEGKVLWEQQDNIGGAAEKFRQATLFSPEGRYYFNLCYALYKLSEYRDALTACRAVEPNSNDDRLIGKAAQVIERLEPQVPEPAPDPYPTPDPEPTTPDPGSDPGPEPTMPDPTTPDPGPEPTTPDPTTPDPNRSGPDGPPPPPDGTQPAYQDQNRPPPPLPELEREIIDADEYQWSVGAALGVLGANVGRDGAYSGTGGQLKLDINFLLLPERRIGVQGFLGLSALGGDDIDSESLTIVDVGGAVYRHIPRKRFYMTPLVGLQVALMQPEASLDALATLGLHGQLAFSLPVGPDRRHVLSIAPSLNLYAAASGMDAMDAGFDQASVSFVVSVGYTLRFTTPFGQNPLIILE